MNNLLSFWNEAKLEGPPYAHPKDEIPAKYVQQDVSSYSEFIQSFEGGALLKTALHLSLLPQPYHGDLENAEILILLINPGLTACDYHVEENYPKFREDLIGAIRQERRSHIFLDPKWAWTSGFIWWESKLRDVAEVIAKERFNGNYGRALSDLARRVACVELVPYHSRNFGSSTTLASADAARRFVASVNSKRTIIVARAVKDWGLPDAENIIKYQGSQARNVSFKSKKRGGRAILRSYGLEPH